MGSGSLGVERVFFSIEEWEGKGGGGDEGATKSVSGFFFLLVFHIGSSKGRRVAGWFFSAWLFSGVY